ncbi:MAG: hypothetical protein HZB62_10095 [Nitrospirae bacterium]|nr:hypothetical protein [Nitrospirota bacterium]
MIYLEEKQFDRQLDLLGSFLAKGEFDLIIWFSPESKRRSICNLGLAPKDLIEGEQVTTYGNGFKPNKTRRTKLTADLLTNIREASRDIQVNCDSLALYPADKKNWIACTIEHEGMCLVSDDSLIDTLASKDFNPSLEKPQTW